MFNDNLFDQQLKQYSSLAETHQKLKTIDIKRTRVPKIRLLIKKREDKGLVDELCNMPLIDRNGLTHDPLKLEQIITGFQKIKPKLQ